MNEEEYGRWMDELVERGAYDRELAEDFKIQRRLFESAFRSLIETTDIGLPPATFGVVAGESIFSESAPELVARATRQYPGRAIYFETLHPGLG